MSDPNTPSELRTRDPRSVGRIVTTPGVLGGRPRVEGTRVGTEHVWACHDDGADLEEILRVFPVLEALDVFAALEYERAARLRSA